MLQIYFRYLSSFLIWCFTVTVQAQQTDVPPAQFDVIIKTNGEIITARVLEVGLTLVRYKRTDIPDGPVYEMLRKEIYAISYRNQLKEILTPIDSTRFAQIQPIPILIPPIEGTTDTTSSTKWHTNIGRGEIRVGAGFIRHYSGIKNASELNPEAGTTAIQLTYLFPYRQNIHIGVLTGLGNFKYSESTFSEYDQLQINQQTTETLFTVALVGKYERQFKTISPYAIGGIALYSSMAKSNASFSYLGDDRSVQVQNSIRNNGLGIIVRVGFQAALLKRVGAYVDFGNGLTLGQAGLVIKR
ncbi:MAG: hypothetical protein KF856_12690 [Cyclobacteriaceae bacterium]|nr:hypothetical protein [Cyclobacteriaceae bacterium]